MVSRLVILWLVHSFPHENLPQSLIPFTLLSDVHTINFGIDVTIDDVLFNDIDMETQTLHPNGIPWCGSKEKGYILLSTLIHPCCVVSILIPYFYPSHQRTEDKCIIAKYILEKKNQTMCIFIYNLIKDVYFHI